MDIRKEALSQLSTGENRVVIADDSQTQVRLVEKCLIQLGFPKNNLIAVSSAAAAFQEVTKRQVDILILDLYIPEREFAIDLIRTLRKKVGNELSILVISAHSEKSEVHEAFSAGANGYLLKPITMPRLREKIRPLLHHAEDLGDYLVQRGYTNQQDIDTAMDLQRTYFHHVSLAKAALWLGFISPEEFAKTLCLFDCHDDDAFLEKCRLLNLLNQEQINSLLRIQLRVERKLGDVLMMMGALKKDLYEKAVEELEFAKKSRSGEAYTEQSGTQPDFLNEGLFGAVRDSEITYAKRFLAEGVPVNATTPQGKTPLLLACENDDLEMSKLLLEAGADVNAQSRDRTGWRPLMYAIKANNLPLIALLLEAGADPFLTDKLKETSFALTIQRELPLALEMLIQHSVEALAQDPMTWNAIVNACHKRGGVLAKVVRGFRGICDH